jgi:pilus assembly protein CpaC
MVYHQMQSRSRIVVPAQRYRWLQRWLAGVFAMAVVAAGLMVITGHLGAQPADETEPQGPPPLPTPSRFAELADPPQKDEVEEQLKKKDGLPSPVIPEIPQTAPAKKPENIGAPPQVVPAMAQDEKALPKEAAPPVPVDKMPQLPPPAVAPPLNAEAPFGPEQPRMGRLADAPFLGNIPKATEEELKEYNQLVDRVIDPGHTFDIIVGRTRLIILKETPSQIQVADDSILGQNLLNPKQLTVIGRRIGTTVLTVWFPDPKDRAKDKILSYLVRVLPDPTIKLRLEAAYKALANEIKKVFPDSYIKLELVGDKLVVSGEVKDVFEAVQILRILRANSPSQIMQTHVTNLNLTVTPGDLLNPSGLAGLENYLNTAGGAEVINLLRIPGEQQVMLRVTVAEVNRTAARTIGVNFNILKRSGGTVFGQQTGNITVTGNVLSNNNTTSQGTVQANVPVILDNGQLPIAIEALKTLNYARSLAEPNMVAFNGLPANFQVGGSFPVPVLGGGSGTTGGSNLLTGVQFVPYGVQLSFTPTITDRDRVRLQIQANVSTRDESASTIVGGSSVPGLSTRNFNTTVEMREGQSMAVGGLIQTNLAAATNRVPLFGDIPILNRFMGVDNTQSGEQELVIMVTPELVHPLEKKEVPKMPGSDLFEPSDLEFFVCGRVENRRNRDYRAPVMNDIHRMIQYHRCEQTYIFGPVGHTDDPNYPLHPYDQYDSSRTQPRPPVLNEPMSRTHPPLPRPGPMPNPDSSPITIDPNSGR